MKIFYNNNAFNILIINFLLKWIKKKEWRNRDERSRSRSF